METAFRRVKPLKQGCIGYNMEGPSCEEEGVKEMDFFQNGSFDSAGNRSELWKKFTFCLLLGFRIVPRCLKALNLQHGVFLKREPTALLCGSDTQHKWPGCVFSPFHTP